jgi:hypothetical protein
MLLQETLSLSLDLPTGHGLTAPDDLLTAFTMSKIGRYIATSIARC